MDIDEGDWQSNPTCTIVRREANQWAADVSQGPPKAVRVAPRAAFSIAVDADALTAQ